LLPLALKKSIVYEVTPCLKEVIPTLSNYFILMNEKVSLLCRVLFLNKIFVKTRSHCEGMKEQRKTSFYLEEKFLLYESDDLFRASL
jgi:hypothetical protein